MDTARELQDPLLGGEAPYGSDPAGYTGECLADLVGVVEDGGSQAVVAAPAAAGTAASAAAAAESERRAKKGERCLLRGLYFLGGVSNVSWGRFAAIFYISVGLNAFQIGILEGAMPVTAAICQPVWGFISDKTRQRKRVFLVTKAVASAVLLLQAVPQIVEFGFPAILCISVGMSMFVAPGVLDAYALDVLGESSGDYGTLRLWMAVSWGLGSTAMGVLTDLAGGNFTYNFVIYAVFALTGTVLIAWKVPSRSASEKAAAAAAAAAEQDAAANNEKNRLRFRDLVRAVCARSMVLFWPLIIVFGICVAVVERLLFVFLQHDLNASTTLCGATVGVSVLFELPVFYYGKRILRWAGHDLLFLTAMVAYIVRVIGYSFLTSQNVLLILPLEALHGLTFATMWTAAVDKTAVMAPKAWLTSYQMLLSACFQSIGVGIGSPVGGWIMQHYGAVFMYQCAAFLMFAMLVVLAVQVALARVCRWCCRARGNGDRASPGGRIRQPRVAGDGPIVGAGSTAAARPGPAPTPAPAVADTMTSDATAAAIAAAISSR